MRETGVKRMCIPLDPFGFNLYDLSRVFEDHFCAWSKQKAWSKEIAPPWGHELVGCMLHHVASVCSLTALHRTFEFIHGFHFRFTWSPGLLFFSRVHVMCVLRVVTVMLLF